MDAQCIGANANVVAIHRAHDAFGHHPFHLCNRLLLVFDHRVHVASRRERAVVLVSAIGKHFVGCAQADILGGFDHGAAG